MQHIPDIPHYEHPDVSGETQRWCSACERDADDCVCEELSDHFREVNPDSPQSDPRGSEQEPYTHEEATVRRREQTEDGFTPVQILNNTFSQVMRHFR